MDCKFSITSYDGNGNSSKSYGNCVKRYIATVGVTEMSPEGVSGELLPHSSATSSSAEVYESFWAWADAVGRAIIALSSDTYVDSKVSASWSINEEVSD